VPPAAAWFALALIVVAYGALLRLDAFVGGYGTLNRPAWARVVTNDVAPLAGYLRPNAVHWRRIPTPYVGGDPINYLKYGREMRSFYQPHVREPVFLATTRLALAALAGQDAAVSLASLVGSVLVILATYLLGRALVSSLAGIVAAFVVAIDYDMITWAPDGWRDDMFTATVVLAAAAFVRFHRRPAFWNALAVGGACGLACLTRITALSFALPALGWVALAGSDGDVRARREYSAVAFVILTAIVAPFLISCAIATGDPFFAINYHTSYYRFAEGMPSQAPVSAGGYLRMKFASHPLATLDAGVTGEFVRPFAIKWLGLNVWSPLLAAGLRFAALAGLASLPFSRQGRLVLLILLASLLPYAFTWNVGAGGEWRFTMHAYPLYIVAAMIGCAGLYRGLLMLYLRPDGWRSRAAAFARRAALVCAIAAAAVLAYVWFPWLVVREAIVKGDSISIETGDRDSPFYRGGWSRPHREGLATVRVSQAARAAVHFPLPRRENYDVIVRADPVAPDSRQTMTVLFNQQVVLRTALDWNPQRVGTYRVHLPPEWIKSGDNELTLIASPLVPAADAGSRFYWLDPAATIGIRLWYIRIMPAAPALSGAR
jgi:hypothetical protein